jgi:hypothetical protein
MEETGSEEISRLGSTGFKPVEFLLLAFDPGSIDSLALVQIKIVRTLIGLPFEPVSGSLRDSFFVSGTGDLVWHALVEATGQLQWAAGVFVLGIAWL